MADDFIREMIKCDVAAGKHGGKVVTRFPPEPNGWLHIGHAKAICIDLGVAKEMGGRCHLRMDDTNPTTEDMEYVEAIQRDVRWLGFDWGTHLYYASDYFERFYELGELLIQRGRAYVCDLPDDEFSKSYRGTITEAGKESPYRKRSVEENLDLFRRMKAGEFKDGERVLRARIDMSSPNMKMRDPPLVRIKHAHHYRTDNKWCIYPLYDYAHCLEDSFEGVTHSLCTLEFESARELYDWVIKATEVPHVPKQTEFARLAITYTVMSKRKLLQLVEQKHVNGWDDPRMPTIAGLRRRGYTPEALRTFCERIGVAKNISTVDVALLEHTLREDLDPKSPRRMAVLAPIELVVEGFPENEIEELEAPDGRKLPFGKTLFIEKDDFAEDPPKGWFRLAPGKKVRLRHAYIVTCTGFDKDADGNVVRVKCSYDPSTRGGTAPAGERIDGTIHWVSTKHAKDVEVRLYDRLFKSENPGADDRDFLLDLNPDSLKVVTAKGEPSLGNAKAGDRFQLERLGFFFGDPDSKAGAPVLNRTVSLKDSWAKQTKAPVAPVSAKPKNAPAAPTPNKVIELTADEKALRDAHGLSDDEARTLLAEPALKKLFDAAPRKDVASVLVNDLLGVLRAKKIDTVPFDASAVLELVDLTKASTISSKQAKDVLAEMVATGKGAKAIVEAKGMKQIANADDLAPVVDAVLAENADAVGRYKAGNANVFGALVGLVMKKSKGQANPKLVTDLLKQKLG